VDVSWAFFAFGSPARRLARPRRRPCPRRRRPLTSLLPGYSSSVRVPPCEQLLAAVGRVLGSGGFRRPLVLFLLSSSLWCLGLVLSGGRGRWEAGLGVVVEKTNQQNNDQQ
jgi:hypothetical protein